ncbi:MAG: hypothetical protein ACFFCS_22090 [Candidatus Hodarchaeota archaeon]
MKLYKSDINEITKDIDALDIGKEKYFAFIRNTWKNPHLTKEQKYSLTGKLFLKQPEFFMDEIYEALEKFVFKEFSEEELIDMERHIMQNLCMCPIETNILDFPGTLFVGKIGIRGRIYVTNLRLIVQGVKEKAPLDIKAMIGWHAGLHITASHLGATYMKPHTGNYVENVALKLIPESPPGCNGVPKRLCFGYSIPLYMSLDVLSFSKHYLIFDIQHLVKGEQYVKDERIRFAIAVRKFRNESKAKYFAKKNEIFSVIEEIIKKHLKTD